MGKWFTAMMALMLFLLLQVSGYMSYAPENPERQEAVVRFNRPEREQTSWSAPLSDYEKGIRHILANNYAQPASTAGWDVSQCKDWKASKFFLTSLQNYHFISDRKENLFRLYEPPLCDRVVDYYVYTLRKILI